MISEDLSQELSKNITNFYEKATKKKIFLENIHNFKFSIPSIKTNSYILWNNNNNIVSFKKKFNHLFLYNCSNLTLRNINCVSGITMINCNNCRLLFKTTPNYNIEISNCRDIIFLSFMFYMPLFFKNCNFKLCKYYNYTAYEFLDIYSPFFSNWHIEYFNF